MGVSAMIQGIPPIARFRFVPSPRPTPIPQPAREEPIMPMRRRHIDILTDGPAAGTVALSRGTSPSAALALSRSRARDEAAPPGPAFLLAESLLRVWSRHVRTMMEVRTSRKKLELARAYL